LLLEDEGLKTLASNAYAKLAVEISKVNASFLLRLRDVRNDYHFCDYRSRIRSLLDKAEDEAFVKNKTRVGSHISLPLYYRNMYNNLSAYKTLRESVAPLVKNNLAFAGSGNSSGETLYNDSFLCAEIEDEDLPWDITEFDW
jgi:hypothetical protein